MYGRQQPPWRPRPAKIAARARAVFDDELLAEIFAQRVRDRARKGIDGGTGRERHDKGDRAAWPLLCDRVVTWRNGKCEAHKADRQHAHVSSELYAGRSRWSERLFCNKLVQALAAQPFG